jgi:hypothetical protein
LNALLDQPEAQFVLVYGRRRLAWITLLTVWSLPQAKPMSFEDRRSATSQLSNSVNP